MPDLAADAWTLAALLGDGGVRAALLALADWPLARFLRQTSTAYILLNAGHILSIGLLIGSIAVLDLRLLGGFGRQPVAILAPPLLRMAMVGAGLAILTGLALFTVRPDAYLANQAFTVKLVLIGCALVNALVLRRSRSWRAALDGGGPIPPSARLAAALSLALWPASVLAGRWIGFL